MKEPLTHKHERNQNKRMWGANPENQIQLFRSSIVFTLITSVSIHVHQQRQSDSLTAAHEALFTEENHRGLPHIIVQLSVQSAAGMRCFYRPQTGNQFHLSTSSSIIMKISFFFWINVWNEVCVEHKIKIFPCFTWLPERVFFEAFTCLEKCLNGTTDFVETLNTMMPDRSHLLTSHCVSNQNIISQTSRNTGHSLMLVMLKSCDCGVAYL